MFKNPNKEALQKEKEIQDNIYKCIDEFKSFVFYAGAGAGKTYALKEGLRYLLKHKREILKRRNQKIICITYTNVAVNEIKRRIGNTEFVLVSTIHERMWDFIKNYQKELILIHKEKLESEISNLQDKIEQDSFYNTYSNKERLKELILENAKELKKLQDLKAREYKENIEELINITFSNAGNFKKLINNIIKIEKYKHAVEQIDNNKIKEVKYTMLFNSDRLEKMQFSHDTLLEYALQMVEKYEILQRILIDKYPYILVDEFQDTNENVVKLLKKLYEYSKSKNKNFLIGYFGDAYQKIYSDGVGKEIIQESYLVKIEKTFNRRSTNEIIQLINKIRDDNLKQESIFLDADGGKIKIVFGNGEVENIQEYINSICDEHHFNKDNKLHVMFLTNKLIAKFARFEEFYDFFENFIYYNELTTQVMSKDTTKLNQVVKYIFDLITLYIAIKDKKSLNLIVDKNKLLKNISLKTFKENIREINEKLKDITSLKDLLEALYKVDKNENVLFQILYDQYIQYENIDAIKITFIEKLQIENDKFEKLDEFFNLSLDIFIKWYNYIISDDENSVLEKVIYHTYHSTKGEEYDNVLIVMENNFGIKRKNAIKKFFIDYENCDEDIKNLIYVSFSRARKNLFIYYIDENLSDDEKEKIESFIKGI